MIYQQNIKVCFHKKSKQNWTSDSFGCLKDIKLHWKHLTAVFLVEIFQIERILWFCMTNIIIIFKNYNNNLNFFIFNNKPLDNHVWNDPFASTNDTYNLSMVYHHICFYLKRMSLLVINDSLDARVVGMVIAKIHSTEDSVIVVPIHLALNLVRMMIGGSLKAFHLNDSVAMWSKIKNKFWRISYVNSENNTIEIDDQHRENRYKCTNRECFRQLRKWAKILLTDITEAVSIPLAP